MTTCIALLRGINVVGRRMLAMDDLRRAIEQCGGRDVRTYIQSGNVVFRSQTRVASRLETKIAGAIASRHGFEPHVVVLTSAELASAAAGNPFPEANETPTSVHLFFLARRPPKPDLKSLEAIRAKSERFVLNGRIFYLHTPDGFGASKLAGRAERLLGVEATARNWRTVTTLLEMAGGSR
jgi:uncharacterized protein (DUF1697 family)